ncbi:hypothetical protein JS756_29130 [Streptomyces actuosus]|uniref:Proline-rich protein n=1 Tax=Streptomyces actuosus TaxID=1885 RepID=A0ABS2VY71_STRAS|nr:hypothetical protein [Streptomyces actuosus]
MAGAAPPWPTVPPPRRPPGANTRVRRWYENELGWPTVPGEPLRLPLGVRFDVLDVPAQAGRAALQRVPAGCPVALRGDRMALLVAAGSAEELPGLLEWLEWGGLPLDLRALGTGAKMDAPPPPAGLTRPSGIPEPSRRSWPRPASGPSHTAHRGPGRGPDTQDRRNGQDGHDTEPSAAHAAPGSRGTASARTAAWDAAEAYGPRSVAPAPPDPGPAPAPPDPGPASGSPEPESLTLSRSDTVQPTTVWLRPPVPGREVEASLPSLTALGSTGGTPDLVRLVDTVATHCHRIRLRRTCAQPLAFS